MLNFEDFTISENEVESLCIVRVTTDYWSDKKGLYQKKSIKFLRRQCKGFNILEEDISALDAKEVITRIYNLNEVKDGVYMVTIFNVQKDWETDYIEDYDYKLVEIKE